MFNSWVLFSHPHHRTKDLLALKNEPCCWAHRIPVLWNKNPVERYCLEGHLEIINYQNALYDGFIGIKFENIYTQREHSFWSASTWSFTPFTLKSVRDTQEGSGWGACLFKETILFFLCACGKMLTVNQANKIQSIKLIKKILCCKLISLIL